MSNPFSDWFWRLTRVEHKIERQLERGVVVGYDPEGHKVMVQRARGGDPVEAEPQNLSTGTFNVRVTFAVGQPVLLDRIGADGKQFAVRSGTYHDKNPAPSSHGEEFLISAGDMELRLHVDRAEIKVGSASGVWTEDKILLKVGGASISITDGEIELEGASKFKGGPVTHDGIPIDKNHAHDGIVKGLQISGTPVG